MPSYTLSLLLICMFIVRTINGQWTQAERGCPKGCYCENTKVQCSALQAWPTMPVDTTIFEMTQPSFRHMPPHAFERMPNLTSFKMDSANIANIQGCSFTNLPKLKTINFMKCVIGNIEEYAFNNLQGLEELHIVKSRIGRIKSFAFNNLSKIDSFQIIGTHIQNFYMYGFNDISNITTMIVSKSNFSDFVTDAFHDIVNVKRGEFHANQIWNMHCGVLETFKQIFTGAYVFSTNTFYCNCTISWLLNDEGKKNFPSVIQKNKCHGPDYPEDPSVNLTGRALQSLDFRDLGCKKLDTTDKTVCKRTILTPNPRCPTLSEWDVYESASDKENKDKNGDNSVQKLAANLTFVGLLSILVLSRNI